MDGAARAEAEAPIPEWVMRLALGSVPVAMIVTLVAIVWSSPTATFVPVTSWMHNAFALVYAGTFVGLLVRRSIRLHTLSLVLGTAFWADRVAAFLELATEDRYEAAFAFSNAAERFSLFVVLVVWHLALSARLTSAATK